MRWTPVWFLIYAVSALLTGGIASFAFGELARWLLDDDAAATVIAVIVWATFVVVALLILVAIFMPVVKAVRRSLDE